MTVQVQMCGAAETTVDARTKAAREWDVDTTNGRPSIGDCATAGGIKIPNYKDLYFDTSYYSKLYYNMHSLNVTHILHYLTDYYCKHRCN